MLVSKKIQYKHIKTTYIKLYIEFVFQQITYMPTFTPPPEIEYKITNIISSISSANEWNSQHSGKAEEALPVFSSKITLWFYKKEHVSIIFFWKRVCPPIWNDELNGSLSILIVFNLRLAVSEPWDF